MTLRFGACVLDTAARRVRRDGDDVHLSPKAFELLCLLVERRPAALSKADLHQHIWPDTFVADDSLARLVTEVRRGIGDEARDARLLRTVHGFGYAFTEHVETLRDEVAARWPGPRCWLCWEGRELLLEKPSTLIGRDPAADVHLESPRVSRQHARIVASTAEVVVEDLGSRNGTFHRGAAITQPTPLVHGDEIRIGPFVLTFRASAPQLTTEVEIPPE